MKIGQGRELGALISLGPKMSKAPEQVQYAGNTTEQKWDLSVISEDQYRKHCSKYTYIYALISLHKTYTLGVCVCICLVLQIPISVFVFAFQPKVGMVRVSFKSLFN